MKFELFYKSYCKKIFRTHEITMGLPWWLKWKRICLQMQEMWVQSLDWEDPLEKEMANHSSILAWEILWTEQVGRLQSVDSQKGWTQLSDLTTLTNTVVRETEIIH